jgi:hypothetical protein
MEDTSIGNQKNRQTNGQMKNDERTNKGRMKNDERTKAIDLFVLLITHASIFHLF